MQTLHSITFSTLSRWLFVLAVFIVPRAVWATTTWQAIAGAQSSDQGTQALAFLPNELWIHAGDRITWTWATDEDHTVTFLTPGQTRPTVPMGCPGTTPDSPVPDYDGSTCVNSGPCTRSDPSVIDHDTGMKTAACVNSGPLVTYTVQFLTAGNFKLVCLRHANMTGTVHVLNSETLPHDQAFYDDQAHNERSELLSDGSRLKDRGTDTAEHSSGDEAEHSSEDAVTAGIGEIVATGGGSQTVSVMRFLPRTTVVHVGDTVEWTNLDPVTPHTVTFGTEPADPHTLVGLTADDADGARHAVPASLTDINSGINSGFLVAAPQDRGGPPPPGPGLPQSPLGVQRFRVTFTFPGIFNYYCALHDTLGPDSMGMVGRVIVHR